MIRGFLVKVARAVVAIMWPWGACAMIVFCIAAPDHGWAHELKMDFGYLFTGGACVFFTAAFVYVIGRAIIQAMGHGKWACAKGLHSESQIPMHSRVGFTSRVTTYLAVNGRTINRCDYCGRYDPPEGEEVHKMWLSGQIVKTGGTLLTKPSFEVLPKPPKRS